MVVWINPNLLPEKQYIIDFFLKYVFDLDYQIKYHEKPQYIIEFDGKKAIFVDSFFYKFTSPQEYLKKENLPQQITYYEDEILLAEKDLPVLYGKNKLFKEKNLVFSEIDIFAASFLFLTRWEEYVIDKKDKHNRFDETQSFIVKYRLWNRPVVNEYIEFLKNIFNFLGLKADYKFDYEIFLTHDVDHSTNFHSFFNFSRDFFSSILKRKDFLKAKKTANHYLKYIRGKENDPFDTFDYLMDISEKYNTKSHFYFIPALKDDNFAYYNYDDKAIKNYIEKIKQRGHIIGLHGSYDSFNNFELYKMEKERFESLYGKVEENRQHFLRFAVPLTWDILEKNRIKLDSSMGFTSFGGFRSGICFKYPVFDIVQRKKLNIYELPLIAMEAALLKQSENKVKFLKNLTKLAKKVKKYNGTFVFLWHNTSFYFPEFSEIHSIYEDAIKILAKPY